MTRPVYTVRIDTPIEQVTALLAQRQITAAPVLDENGRLAGVISETDLLGYRMLGATQASALWDGDAEEAVGRPTVAREIMTSGVVTVSLDADLGEVAERMLEGNVHSMPVMDDSGVIGMISRSDLVRTLVRTDDAIAAEVQHRLDEYSGGTRRWTASVKDGVVAIAGQFDDDVEVNVVSILARTVPGVSRTEYVADRRPKVGAE
jgi:CBS domain-containing protein